jgi:hypothetical protein
MKCRFCKITINKIFLDLGKCPPSNSLIEYHKIKKEKKFNLITYICNKCWLVQTKDVANKKTFFNNNYPYFSSTSSSWINHAKEYVSDIIKKINLNKNKFVIEIASNDGYLLQFFKKKKIPCLGIEPSKNTAKKSEKLGIKVIKDFFN